MGCHALPQGIFPTQGSHPSLLHFRHWQQILYHLRHLGSPWTIQSKEFSRSEYWSGQPFPPPGDLPNLEIKPRSPPLRAKSLPAEPAGKPENTGAGSLFLLWRTFLTQESNWGLLHCRRILYQLSYQGSLNNKYYRDILFSFFHTMSSISGVYFTLTIHLNLDAKL